MLTERRIRELAKLTYKIKGYDIVPVNGAIGVVDCPPRSVDLMNTFQALLMAEASPEEEAKPNPGAENVINP